MFFPPRDPSELLAAIHSRCWQVESVLPMIEWLRALNVDRPLGDLVEF